MTHWHTLPVPSAARVQRCPNVCVAVVEVEYEAALEEGGAIFDSTEQRSGRPYALLLGNGDVQRGGGKRRV